MRRITLPEIHDDILLRITSVEQAEEEIKTIIKAVRVLEEELMEYNALLKYCLVPRLHELRYRKDHE